MQTSKFYSPIKTLIESKEWKDYETLLEDRRQFFIQGLENPSSPSAEVLRHGLWELNHIRRLPYQIVEEFEQKEKEK